MLKLKDREFEVSNGYIQGSVKDGVLHCFLEVDTYERIIDDTGWEPCLRHQGFIFEVSSWHDLQNTELKWESSVDPSYKHPETGILYVFGHAETTGNYLKFGRIRDDKIEVNWQGYNDIFWDDDFGQNVPFELHTCLQIKNV